MIYRGCITASTVKAGYHKEYLVSLLGIESTRNFLLTAKIVNDEQLANNRHDNLHTK